MKLEKVLGLTVFGLVVATTVMLLSSFTGAANPQPTSLSVGYVDMERLQTELPDFQRFRELIKDKTSEFELYRGYMLQQYANTLKSLNEKQTQEKNGKSAEEAAAIEKKYKDEAQRKSEEVNSQLEQKENEIKKQLNEQRKVIMDKLKKSIADVANDKKYSVVFEKNVIFYGGTDISDLLIEKAKKEAEAAKAATASPQPTKK